MDKNHADCHQCLSVNGSPQAKNTVVHSFYISVCSAIKWEEYKSLQAIDCICLLSFLNFKITKAELQS